MTNNQKIFYRILQKKMESEKTWDQAAREAHIHLATWMTGQPGTKPSDDDLKKLAPVFDTTFEYLKYGRKK